MANMSQTIGDMNTGQHVNDYSAMGHYMQAVDAFATIRQPMDMDKTTLLPSLVHLQSDDSLFGESKQNGFGGDNKMMKYHGISAITDGRMNMTELTAP